jgi:hypothetical protein
MEEVETFIILHSGTEASVLYEAADMAIVAGGQTALDHNNGARRVPTIENTARGAALRSRDWIKYWQGCEQERLYWEQFDEDDPDTWERDQWENKD